MANMCSGDDTTCVQLAGARPVFDCMMMTGRTYLSLIYHSHMSVMSREIHPTHSVMMDKWIGGRR